jgi:hypothetical protein
VITAWSKVVKEFTEILHVEVVSFDANDEKKAAGPAAAAAAAAVEDEEDEHEEREEEREEEDEEEEDEAPVTCVGTWSLRDHDFSGEAGGSEGGSSKKGGAAGAEEETRKKRAAASCTLNVIAVVSDAQGVPLLMTGDSTGRIVAVPIGLVVSA